MRGLISVVIVAITVIVQLTVVDRIAFPGGAGPDLVLLVVAALALAGGPLAGALTGFWAGLALDVAPPGSHFVGQNALVFCLIGYACGLLADDSSGDAAEQGHTALFEIVVTAGAAVCGEALAALLAVMLSDPRVTWPAIRNVLPAAVAYDVLLCPFVLYAVAAALRLAGARGEGRRVGWSANQARTPAPGANQGAIRQLIGGNSRQLRLSDRDKGPAAIGGLHGPGTGRPVARREPRLKLGRAGPGTSTTAYRDGRGTGTPRVRFGGRRREGVLGGSLLGSASPGASALRASALRGSGLGGSALRGSGLGGSALRGSGLGGSALRGSGLGGSALRGSGLGGSALRGSGLGGSALRGSGLGGSALRGSALRGSALRGSGLGGSALGGSALRGSGLGGSGLRSSGLGGSRFGSSSMGRSLLGGSVFTRSSFLSSSSSSSSSSSLGRGSAFGHSSRFDRSAVFGRPATLARSSRLRHRGNPMRSAGGGLAGRAPRFSRGGSFARLTGTLRGSAALKSPGRGWLRGASSRGPSPGRSPLRRSSPGRGAFGRRGMGRGFRGWSSAGTTRIPRLKAPRTGVFGSARLGMPRPRNPKAKRRRRTGGYR